MDPKLLKLIEWRDLKNTEVTAKEVILDSEILVYG